MLGYGGTDKPSEASEYSTKKLCADLAALLDLLNIKRAVSTTISHHRSARLINYRCLLAMIGVLSPSADLLYGTLIDCWH